MKKTMNGISVYTTDDGQITIDTPTGFGELESVVISPEQVEVLIKWLLEAKDEIVGEERD